jgi:hypothetical protein
MSEVLINFSGHKLCEESKGLLEERYEIIEDVPFFEIDFDSDVEKQLTKIVRKLKIPLDGSKAVSIIPPGHATVAILLMVFLHGILGYFPKICMLKPEGSGQYIPKNIFCIDGYLVRKAGRSFRQELWNKELKCLHKRTETK